VKAPLTWPNSSLSKTPSESPPTFTTTRERSRRRLAAVDPPRHDLLAGACSPVTRHVGVAGANPLHAARAPGAWPETRPPGRQPALRELGFLLQPLGGTERAGELHLGAEGGEEAGVVPRLLDEVTRAQPHRLDGLVDAAQAVMTITGSVGSLARMRERRSSPSRPEVVSRCS
jgi:hypothetical protein